MATRAALFVIFAFSITNSAWAQLPLRGHAFQRDGLFHTQRVRWGGGLTPQGAAILMHGIDVFGPILGNVLVPHDVDLTPPQSQAASKTATAQSAQSFRSSAVWQDYLKEQSKANDLLVRTANLVGGPTEPAPTQPPPGSNGNLQDPPGAAAAAAPSVPSVPTAAAEKE